ncbi:MAG: cysteine synthase A, partial [Cyanobium sp.]
MGGICQGFTDAVGQTPLIRLRALSDITGCDILGKAEFMNPGGSVKDRAALGILLEAEASGELRPGGTVVEGTAGNTGIGLAHLCNARGYRSLIVIPDTQSAEKIGLLRSLGAEVRTVPAVPYADPNNYVKLSGRIAAETPGAVWANQFDNLANRRAHYQSTGPEIWEQCEGKVDAWVAATGTGGTYAGVALFLTERSEAVRCVLADPHNSVRLSGRIAEETSGAVWANQFDNLANRRAHFNSTGPEIWEQCDGRVDAWVAATGTGGTYAGVALFLKERSERVRCVLADPHGSALYSWATSGELRSEGNSITEGIGNSRVTANLADAPIDDAVRIDDQQALGAGGDQLLQHRRGDAL